MYVMSFANRYYNLYIEGFFSDFAFEQLPCDLEMVTYGITHWGFSFLIFFLFYTHSKSLQRPSAFEVLPTKLFVAFAVLSVLSCPVLFEAIQAPVKPKALLYL